VAATQGVVAAGGTQTALKMMGLEVDATAMSGHSGTPVDVSVNVTDEVGDVPAVGIFIVAVNVKGWFTTELPCKAGEVTTVEPCI
jgi:hypothetical protein